MPVIVLGGIVGGVFTPTEAGAIAAGYAFLLACLVYRELKWSRDHTLAGARGDPHRCGHADRFGQRAVRLDSGTRTRHPLIDGRIYRVYREPWLFLASVNIALLIFGIFFEPVPLMILMTPVLMPLLAQYGVDPVHFGVMITLNMTLGPAHAAGWPQHVHRLQHRADHDLGIHQGGLAIPARARSCAARGDVRASDRAPSCRTF